MMEESKTRKRGRGARECAAGKDSERLLCELAPGESGRVLTVKSETSAGRLLLEAGVLPGGAISVLRKAPGGSPLTVESAGTVFTLRRDEAASVSVLPGAAAVVAPVFAEEAERLAPYVSLFRESSCKMPSQKSNVPPPGGWQVALIGVPNCGKSTFFHALTGVVRATGNYPGVTVDGKAGRVRGIPDIHLLDLPGITSLCACRAEEKLTANALEENPPDAVLFLVDAVRPRQSFSLLLQVLSLGLPMLVVCNRLDEVRRGGGEIRTDILSPLLGVRVVAASAVTGEGMSEAALLLRETLHGDCRHVLRAPQDSPGNESEPFSIVTGVMKKVIFLAKSAFQNEIEGGADKKRETNRTKRLPDNFLFLCARAAEGNKKAWDMLKFTPSDSQAVEAAVADAEQKTGHGWVVLRALFRYRLADELAACGFTHPSGKIPSRRTAFLDRMATGRFTALPLAAFLIFLVFFLSFDLLGGNLSRLFAAVLERVASGIEVALAEKGVQPLLRGLLTDGILRGTFSVLSFLPVIGVLFLLLSFLEDSGYLARVAYLTDPVMRRFGLSGRSCIPMLLGFGCSVPALMATRTLSGRRERHLTALLLPYVSCSAKIPIYACFCAAFAPGLGWAAMLCLCIFALALSAPAAFLFGRAFFAGEETSFFMALPDYRFPSFRHILALLWEKIGGFLQKTFTVVLLCSVLVWFLGTFTVFLQPATAEEESLLALLGGFLSPIFQPLGFGNWRAVSALLTGLTAKEAILGTLGVLGGVSIGDLPALLPALFTPSSSVSFLLFVLLYPPCAAAQATAAKEMGVRYSFFALFLLPLAAAWLVSFCAYSLMRGI